MSWGHTSVAEEIVWGHTSVADTSIENEIALTPFSFQLADTVSPRSSTNSSYCPLGRPPGYGSRIASCCPVGQTAKNYHSGGTHKSLLRKLGDPIHENKIGGVCLNLFPDIIKIPHANTGRKGKSHPPIIRTEVPIERSMRISLDSRKHLRARREAFDSRCKLCQEMEIRDL